MDETINDIVKVKLRIILERMDSPVGNPIWVDDVIIYKMESQTTYSGEVWHLNKG